MRSLIPVLSAILLTFLGCAYTTPFSVVNARMSMENARIVAVLDFEQQSMPGGDKTGSFAADELTTALFLSQQMTVVDRSHVRTILTKNNITPTLLETKDIQQLGKLLDADFIILGKLTRLSDGPILPDEGAAEIQIAFRILAVRDGSVVGMVEYKKNCKGDMQVCIKGMIGKMAGKVEIEG